MAGLKATLFGKLAVQRGNSTIKGIDARKVQELLSYLLVFRNHPHRRELLCETLWGDQTAVNSRKCLRQTLWRLHSAIQTGKNTTELVLWIDNDWIQINTSDDFWLDIEEFEKVFNQVKAKKTWELSPHDFRLLKYAAGLYKGDLLEGWYPDWCIFERERFQIMHLLVLDKIVQFCELHKKYEAGLSYGVEILRHDHAYERTHRQLMRLYYLTGNRTQALHQYQRCVLALRKDLGVEPSEITKQLHQQISMDRFGHPESAEDKALLEVKIKTPPALIDILHRLEELTEALYILENKIQAESGAHREAASSQN